MANKTVKKGKNPSKSKERGLFRSKDRRVKNDLKRKKKSSDNKEEDEGKEIVFSGGEEHTDEEMELFFESRKTVKELVSPLGVNPNPLDHMVVDDNGVELYTMCFYVDKLPRGSQFASTYASMFNFPGVTSTVFIEPLVDGASQKQLDKRINQLDAESIAAEKDRDRNRYRKVNNKMADAERYAMDVETGDNRLFMVAFLYVLQATTLDKLRRIVSDFHMVAREKTVECCACYSLHPEAFLSGYPTNRVYVGKKGLISETPVKWHYFDKNALVDIFNHTRSGFSHKNGIFAGHVINTGQPVLYDVYDSSHSGYGVIFSGKTGTGKSATIKMWATRYIDFGYKIRSIDFDARGTGGEYSIMAEGVGGINYQLKPDSKNILNLFEVDVTDEFDEMTQTEYKVLDLATKKSNLLRLIMTMIKDGREIEQFAQETFIKRIVLDAITECYNDRGIYHGKIESIYEKAKHVVNGALSSGMVKKQLPTITDFYKKILIWEKENTNDFYNEPYRIILDSMKEYVRELYYCPSCIHFYTREEFESLKKDFEGSCTDCSTKIAEIHGTKPYFDGQSTVQASLDTPHINFDISQIPEEERSVALLVCMDFMQENFIKKNSADPRKTQKMIMLIDEIHRGFRYPEARQFIDDAYRTYRKRHVSPWAATQALKDFDGYKETQSIVKQATTIILLKQDFQDKGYLAKATPLTSSQIDMVCDLGGDLDNEEDQKERKGEVCLIDNQSKVAFIKIDYLTDSESRIVETDMEKIRMMYKGDSNVA